MKNILYVGNHLQSSHINETYGAVLGPLLEQCGYTLHYTSRKTNKPLRLLDMLWTTYRRRKKTDLVLIDTYSTQNFYYAVGVAWLCRVLDMTYMPILHGGNLPERLKKSPKQSRKLFDNAALNISPSLYLKQEFEEAGYSNVIYIPNTIAIDRYIFHKKNFDVPKLLWVRSFARIYNPELAVRVLHALRQQGYDASLCMVGPDADGSLSKVKALAATLGVTVTFTGKLSKDRWTALSKAYNVFINTTNFDNAPLSVIEAMALGMPIVSTRVGGMPYLIAHGNDGLLVAPDEVEQMTDAVVSIFEHTDQTETMVNRARKKVEDHDWSKVKPLWQQVLNRQ